MIQIDMEMPKFCWWMDGNDYRKCPMVDGKNGCCLHSNVSYATWEEQHKHCPLHEVTDIHTGYVGVDDDYPVSVKQVLNITAEMGALETQSRVRELPRYQVTADHDTISRKQAINALEKSRFPGAPYIDRGILIALREIKKLPPSPTPSRPHEPHTVSLETPCDYCDFTEKCTYESNCPREAIWKAEHEGGAV